MYWRSFASKNLLQNIESRERQDRLKTNMEPGETVERHYHSLVLTELLGVSYKKGPQNGDVPFRGPLNQPPFVTASCSPGTLEDGIVSTNFRKTLRMYLAMRHRVSLKTGKTSMCAPETKAYPRFQHSRHLQNLKEGFLS